MSALFEGHLNRECGEHHSVGGRAWCFECNEWCYPRVPCVRCERPILVGMVEEVRNLVDASDRRDDRRIGRIIEALRIRLAKLHDPEEYSQIPGPIEPNTFGPMCTSMGHEEIPADGESQIEDAEDDRWFPYCAECLDALSGPVRPLQGDSGG